VFRATSSQARRGGRAARPARLPVSSLRITTRSEGGRRMFRFMGSQCSGLRVVGLFAWLLAAVVSCAREAPADPQVEPPASYVACNDPRPEVCTRDYRPVCAQRDAGVRCVTTPCDSTEWITLSNACTACSDPTVLGYRAGPCRKEP
jgi:hypothetical protein